MCLLKNYIAGVNVNDHAIMFQRIMSKLESVTKHKAVIWSRETNNLKNILEESIYQLMTGEEVFSLFKRYRNVYKSTREDRD